ncbi:hemolysin III family protein [Chromohalobacter canadensis]|uniref:PAQR family membrane homeostasis protein TrhA n=1 Tax=Chromohalobacter canadensis TaxID=141389 RepID=UPI0021C0864A|nr:hemolysin III family protein [Chromohalobacter canadensis]MCT8468969.1 hemolysin III family protein [Chromohalobacter canadensis]MCT8472841.1 hemolysin III family protein [Chromohalobacter canadensis]MCT8500293.1 hemolysin III family protein [Chromohalobacter canadensis]
MSHESPPVAPEQDAPFSGLEEALHSISHGIGAVLSLTGMVVLIVGASLAAEVDPWKVVSVSLYGVCLLLLYTASTLYHGLRGARLKRLFQVFDHCAIYLLIAGTYTPFLLVNLRGPLGWVLFTAIWSLALGGIALKIIWPHRLGMLRVGVYLLMGWMIVLAAGQLDARLNAPGLALLVAGGITYTLGVVFYAIRAIPFHHAIWHLFVLGGSVCHYFAVYTAVLPFQA